MYAAWGQPHSLVWLSNDPCDGSWTGVSCTNHIVTGLYCDHVSDLLVNWDPAVGDLTGLVSIVMTDVYEMGGEFPASMSALTNLQTLIITGSKMQGSIPPEFGSLTSLTRFEVSCSWVNSCYRLGPGLQGTLPKQLSSLVNLQYMVLPFNDFVGSLPPQLSTLSSILRLDLGANRFSSAIPPQLSTLTTLTWLGFADNRMSSSVPPQLSTLTRLNCLGLRGNLLSNVIPPQLSSLTNLGALLLDHNQLSGTLPSELSLLFPHFIPSFVAGNSALCGSVSSFPGIDTGDTRLGEACPFPSDMPPPSVGECRKLHTSA